MIFFAINIIAHTDMTSSDKKGHFGTFRDIFFSLYDFDISEG